MSYEIIHFYTFDIAENASYEYDSNYFQKKSFSLLKPQQFNNTPIEKEDIEKKLFVQQNLDYSNCDESTHIKDTKGPKSYQSTVGKVTDFGDTSAHNSSQSVYSGKKDDFDNLSIIAQDLAYVQEVPKFEEEPKKEVEPALSE